MESFDSSLPDSECASTPRGYKDSWQKVKARANRNLTILPSDSQFHPQKVKALQTQVLSTTSDKSLVDLSAMLTQRKLLEGQA